MVDNVHQIPGYDDNNSYQVNRSRISNSRMHGSRMGGSRMANSRMSSSGVRHNTYGENATHNPSSFYRETARKEANRELEVNYTNPSNPSDPKIPSMKQVTSQEEIPNEDSQYEYYKRV